MSKIRTFTLKTEDAISEKRAKAELGAAQYNYKRATLKDADVRVVIKQSINDKIRQKTYYFKKI